jgi:hypothetical protein
LGSTVSFQVQLAGLGEHERSLGHQGVTEQQEVVDAGDERRKRGAPFLDRPLT